MEEVSTKPAKQKKSSEGIKIALTALVVVILCGVSFMGGMAFQKKQNSDTSTPSFAQGQGGFSQNGSGGRISGGFGTVTAISSSSITVKNSHSGSSKTYTITSNTTVKNGTTTASVSDIKVDDSVLVRTSSSDTKTASSITINPEMPIMNGGPHGSGGNSSQDSI